MDRSRILSALEERYASEEKDLSEVAKDLRAIHGSVMPRTYVGTAYGAHAFGGHRIPRILVMSINQSRQGQQLTPDQVRESMRTIVQDADGRFCPDGFGPRALAANLCRWILIQCDIPKQDIEPTGIHESIAYDNFVKWPFDTDRSEPPKEAWKAFYGINKAVLEILRPEIILCLGGSLYSHLWDAVKDHSGYDYERNVREWAFSLIAPWGRSELGWCYHYSNPISPNRAWKELREKGEVPAKLKRLFKEGQCPSPEELVRTMEGMATEYPWWGEQTYAGAAFTRYNPYQRFVAWRICEALTNKWKEASLEG